MIAGSRRFEDLRTRGMTAATSGPGSDGSIYGRVLNSILGTKIKTVTGYQGSAESMLAIERKEVDGATSVSYAAIKTAQRIGSRTRRSIFLHSMRSRQTRSSGRFRSSSISPIGDDRRVLEMVFARQSIGYPYAAPPDVPQDRLEAIRKAFRATLQDPEFWPRPPRAACWLTA
jgi:hypothetical protein